MPETLLIRDVDDSLDHSNERNVPSARLSTIVMTRSILKKAAVLPRKSQTKRRIPDALQHRLSKIHVLSHLELERLLTVITDLRDRAMFLVAYRHGLRASEVSLLRKSDVNLDRTTITIRRLTRRRCGLHTLQADERLALRRYLQSRIDTSAILFVGAHGQAITRRGLDWLIKDYGLEAKIPAKKRHFHVLKHSIATHLLQAGAGLLNVHEWLGHTMLQSTTIYLHLAKSRAHEKAPFPKLKRD